MKPKSSSGFSGSKIIVLLIILALIPVGLFLLLNPKAKKNIPPTVREVFYPKAEYVAGQLIVKYKDSYTIDEITHLKSKLDSIGIDSQKRVFDSNDPRLRNFYVLYFKKDVDIKKVGEDLAKMQEIEAISPNYLSKTQADEPNDPGYVQNRQWDLIKIGMKDAWQITKGSNNIKVAVIDSGIDYNHPDFAGRNITRGPDMTTCSNYQDAGNGEDDCISPKSRGGDPMDQAGHGTHVAGTIGAMTNNGIGIAGINWNVTIVAIKTQNAQGKGAITDNFEAIRWAVDQAHVNIINLSLASSVPCADNRVAGYQEALDYARSKGVLVIVAAGNETEDASLESPASCNGVLVVGNSDQNDHRVSDSNWGGRVAISAPGKNILSTVPSNSTCLPNSCYAQLDGTSMSTPHVAGVAALLLAANPGLSVDKVRECLVQNADPINQEAGRNIGPRLNAFKTLNACSGHPITPTPTTTAAATPIPNQNSQNIQPPTEGRVAGEVFIDSNGNHKLDSGEKPYVGANLTLEGPRKLSTNSDSSGNYIFNVNQAGNYKVNISIAGKLIGSSSTFSVYPGAIAHVSFPLPASYAQAQNQNGQGQGAAPTKKPTPKVQTYSCHEKTSVGGAGSSIQIGNLECTPNN